jgi:putative oxidoreductase
MATFYQWIVNLGNLLQSPLLLAIRLFWGILFAQAGFNKFADFHKTVGFFDAAHIPYSTISVVLAGSAELIGGICLVIGFASRLLSIPLIITMIVAYLYTEYPAVQTILTNPQNFVSKAPFLFLFASLIIFCFGPGIFSVDALIKRYRSTPSKS